MEKVAGAGRAAREKTASAGLEDDLRDGEVGDGGCESREGRGGREKRGRWKAPIHAVGAGLLAAWYYVVFFSTTIHYSTRNDITHLNSTFAFACCGMIASFVLLALFAGRSGRTAMPDGGGVGRRRLDRFGVLTLASAVVMAVGTFVLALIERDYFEQPWCSITSTLSGATFAVMCIAWARRYFASNVRPIAISLGSAFVLAAALYLLVVALPSTAAIALTALLPLGSAALLAAAGAVGSARDGAGATDAGASSAGAGAGFSSAGSSPVAIDRAYVARALATVAVITFAESFERSFFEHVTPVSDTLLYGAVFLGAAVLAVAAACGLNLLFKGRHRADLVSRVSAVLFAALFLVALAGRDQWLVSDFAVKTVSVFATLLALIVLAQATSAYGLSETQSFGFGLGVAIAGCLGGHFVGSLITSFAQVGDHGLECAAGAGIVASLACFLFLANGDVLARLTDCDPERPTTPRRFTLRCQAVAERYGLSPKETEVMMLAAKGRTNERIQEAMGISAGTVNTYFSRLYRKLDVHDRQGMIDIIEETE